MSNLNIHRESFVFFLWKERKKNCYYISWCNSIYFGFGFGDVKIYNTWKLYRSIHIYICTTNLYLIPKDFFKHFTYIIAFNILMLILLETRIDKVAWIHKMARIMRQNPESLNRDCVSWQCLHSPRYRRYKITDNPREMCILVSRAINKAPKSKNRQISFFHYQITSFVESQVNRHNPSIIWSMSDSPSSPKLSRTWPPYIRYKR